MELRSPRHDEPEGIRTLLQENGLPVEDLDTATIDFIVACEQDRPIGVVGLQRFESAGLLRSLAVQPNARRAGMGAALVRAAESRAQAAGLQQLVLLTQTAERFFASRGYAAIARDAAPTPVQDSTEFSSICPSTATCMIKQLDPAP
jgi:amino-acid N-acetyltransferase